MGPDPENLLRSFVAAQQAGLDLIELDLHLSKDGALVVMHDTDVDRTTDGTGPIAEKTLTELRALDAGRGERVPVFEEVLDAVRSPLQAEIKDIAAARDLADVMLRRTLVSRNIRRITLEVVEAARKADLKIIGWVVNTQDHLRLVRALELDGATTDYPEIKRTARFTA